MKVAVIGSGISGLASAWILSQRFEVHLFESDSRLGGHAHTISVSEGAALLPMDTGFLVYNELTYPHLTAFFKKLDVETVASDMSLAVKSKYRNLEWAGTNLDTVFAQRKNLFNSGFLKMLWEIRRFHRESEKNLISSRRQGWSLGQLLDERNYGEYFRQNYLLPIGAAIWSTPESDMLSFPAETFLNFFINHRLLQISGRPAWRTVKNGSVEYVKKIAALLPHVHLNTSIENVKRVGNSIVIRAMNEDSKSRELVFDKLVFATHAPITSRILSDQDEDEKRVLSSFRVQPNMAVLHSDPGLMPELKKCWSSWNVLSQSMDQKRMDVSLTYYLNKLQPIPTSRNYFVTLNPQRRVSNINKELRYDHPQFDLAALRAQRELPSIQGRGGIYYAGAWTRYGFHEDGLLSAVKVGELFGLKPPWSID